VLGVCYGHQLLAHAFSGTVDYHPEGRESGTHTVTLTESAASDALFGTMPSQFSAQLTHKQSVLSLPPQALLLGASDFEPDHAFRIGEYAWGVQFHPEFTDEVMRSYLAVQALDIESEGGDAAALKSGFGACAGEDIAFTHSAQGILIAAPSVRPLDFATVLSRAASCRVVVTVE